jgi:chemotaxis protein MotB
MSDDSQRPIIVKRIKKAAHGHHGGAWKIAYADFVTAMMAFFLLMWLIGSTAKGDFEGIAEYFKTPMKVAFFGGAGTGDASSIIKGGGTDITRTTGQLRRGEVVERDRYAPQSGKGDDGDARQREKEVLETLKLNIQEAIEQTPSLRQFKNQLLLEITADGLHIQIVDEQNRPMFDTASAELKPYSRELLAEIGRLLNGVPNRVSLSGHTDSAQFFGGNLGYSNWELSADRANAARRELVAGGMDEFKVLRVVGLASTVLFDRNDPLSPINRRMSIVVLNKQAEQAMLKQDAGGLQLGAADRLEPEQLAPAPAADGQR